MAIAAMMVIGGFQLFGQTAERSSTLYFQSELMGQMESLKRRAQSVDDFPDHLESGSDYTLEITTCGSDCRRLRLTPTRSHPCLYWELDTTGVMASGRVGCWPQSAVRRLSGESSPPET
jgi:hypothetical protein